MDKATIDLHIVGLAQDATARSESGDIRVAASGNRDLALVDVLIYLLARVPEAAINQAPAASSGSQG